MVWTALKWSVPLLAMIAIVGALTRKTFEVEAVIASPPEAVWSVLMDTAAYPEWNPVFVEVDGAFVEGGRVQNTVRDPSGKLLEMTATVTALTPERELRQKGGVPLVITFDHRWILTPIDGGTLVEQLEVDRSRLKITNLRQLLCFSGQQREMKT